MIATLRCHQTWQANEKDVSSWENRLYGYVPIAMFDYRLGKKGKMANYLGTLLNTRGLHQKH